MITRRAGLLGLMCLPLRHPQAAPEAPADVLAFRLMRHGGEIGHHTLTFERHDDTLCVRIAVDVLVTLWSIPIARYTHRVVETWQAGTLVGLTGETDRNGTREWMTATHTPDGLEVVGSRTERYIAPEQAIGTTYWNRRMVNGPMISLEDGVLLRPTVALGPREPVRLASGDTVTADRYSLSGAVDAELWYDHTDTWAGLAVPVPDGSTVHYERL